MAGEAEGRGYWETDAGRYLDDLKMAVSRRVSVCFFNAENCC